MTREELPSWFDSACSEFVEGHTMTKRCHPELVEGLTMTREELPSWFDSACSEFVEGHTMTKRCHPELVEGLRFSHSAF